MGIRLSAVSLKACGLLPDLVWDNIAWNHSAAFSKFTS